MFASGFCRFGVLIRPTARGFTRVACGPVTETLSEVCALDPANLGNYESMYKFSIENPDKFWGALATSRLKWATKFDQVSECDITKGQLSWFSGGRLNVTENCVDRWADTVPDRTALIWEKDEPGTEERISYRDLKSVVCRLSNLLLSNGVKSGDRVVLYMPVSPLAVAAMLACARIGAVHSVVFAGFSAEALSARINDAQASVVITADEGLRGGKKIPLKQTVDSALEKCSSVKRVMVMQRTGSNVPMNPKRDLFLEKELKTQSSSSCEVVSVDSEHPLFMLYTSGSTGKPKGIVHSHAGYLLYAAVTHKLVFDYTPGDVFGCVADIGWITGHTHVVYGPLANGGTSVLFESVPTYPNPGRYWEMVERLKINQFYSSPTAIRLLLKYGDEWPQKYDRSSLKVLGSVGEPINHEAWEWYNKVVGEERCMLVDTWWQTETGGICISPSPAEPGSIIKPTIAMRPFYGIKPVFMDEKGNPVQGQTHGALCLEKPWPGLAKTVFGDHDRFLQTYFSPYKGYYFTGDGAHRDDDGHYQITGRMDDVINVSGHRLGTAEIEDTLDEHEDVAESAVVSFPHDIKGEGIFAFVELKMHIHESGEEIITDLRQTVKKMIGSFAVPDHVLVVPALPKTRSGKIMRRLLKKVARGEISDLGDTSTLADPTVVDQIIMAHKMRLQRKAKT